MNSNLPKKRQTKPRQLAELHRFIGGETLSRRLSNTAVSLTKLQSSPPNSQPLSVEAFDDSKHHRTQIEIKQQRGDVS
jgi:hypothetical protein